jgi:hypothetical protein
MAFIIASSWLTTDVNLRQKHARRVARRQGGVESARIMQALMPAARRPAS